MRGSPGSRGAVVRDGVVGRSGGAAWGEDAGEQHDDDAREREHEQAGPQARGVGDEPDDRRRQEEAEPHEPRDEREAGAGAQPGARPPAASRPGRGSRRRTRRRRTRRWCRARRGTRARGPYRARRAHPGPRDGALAEAVHEAVPDEAPDELGADERDEAGGGDRRGGAERPGQVDRGPRAARVLDEGARDGDEHERGEDGGRAAPGRAREGRSGPCGLRARRGAGRRTRLGLGRDGVGRLAVEPGQAPAQRDERDHREEGARDREVDAEGQAERDGGGRHAPADDGADRPQRVEAVDDRTAVAALDAQPVRVLRDVRERVHRSAANSATTSSGRAGARPASSSPAAVSTVPATATRAEPNRRTSAAAASPAVMAPAGTPRRRARTSRCPGRARP